MGEKLTRTCDQCGANLNEAGQHGNYRAVRYVRVQEQTRILPVITSSSIDPKMANLVFCDMMCLGKWVSTTTA